MAMFAGEQVFQLLGQSIEQRGGDKRPIDTRDWSLDDVAFPDAQSASLTIGFPHSPPAGYLGAALTEVDREARRVATAIGSQVPPAELYGRGTRLIPVADGLIVRDAKRGSLDVVCDLGHQIYNVAVSQPVSFAFNVAALLQYSKTLVTATLAGKTKSREVEVVPLPAPHPEGFNELVADRPPGAVVSTPAGPLYLPADAEVEVAIKFDYPDGSSVTYQAKPPS